MKQSSRLATLAKQFANRLWPILGGLACFASAWACAGGPSHAKAPQLLQPAEGHLQMKAYVAGEELTRDALAALLSESRVVCVGEQHDNARHHQAQAAMISAAAQVDKEQPKALGLEMFQRPFQGPLSDYARGRITEQQLLKRSQYRKRWGFPFELYRPVMTAARANDLDLLALNSPRELTKAVARGQLPTGATARQTPYIIIPPLDMTQAAHRQFFERAMGHKLPPASPVAPANRRQRQTPPVVGHGSMSMENMYAAQVLWDTTMAEGVATWLERHPKGQVLIAAGLGHCHEAGIPLRLRLAGIDNVLSVRPIERARLSEATATEAMPYYLWLTISSRATAPRSPQLRRRP